MLLSCSFLLLFLLCVCLFLFYFLTKAILKDNRKTSKIVKILISCTILGIGFLSFPLSSGIYFYFLTGLVCGVIGDILLTNDRKKLKAIGGVSFLLGHLFYIRGCLFLATPLLNIPIWSFLFILSILISINIFLYSKKLSTPSQIGWSIYFQVLLFLLLLSTFSNNVLLQIGISSFLVSDFCVFQLSKGERNKFYDIFGLCIYFIAQILIIFAISP